jgi:indole-3-glycerol phosphate synthase
MTMTILDRLAAAAAARVERDKRALGLDALMARCAELPLDHGGLSGSGFAFERALASPGMSFVCEVKKASPSRGVIAEAFPYLEIARDYEAAGASAVSVLTETDFFLGSDRYLSEIAASVALPVLRKDFTVDVYQIYQAKLLGAQAVLLICALLDDTQLLAFIAAADSLGLSALVEAHTEDELARALHCGARVVGVNNRDLRTFDVDLRNCVRLRALAPREVVFVAESGIKDRADIEMLEENGIDAVLVGETLMRAADRRAALRQLAGK